MKNLITLLLISILMISPNCKKEESKKLEDITKNGTKEELSENLPLRVEATKNPTLPNPSGFVNIKEVLGDLDGDDNEELIIVYESNKVGEMGYDRIVKIFKKVNEKWDEIKSAKGPVLGSQAGGVLGDPFEGISIEKGVIKINHFGGSREKWNYEHKYRFQNDKWLLIGSTITNGAPCEKLESFDYNLISGKIIRTVSEEKCNRDGEPIGTPKIKTNSFKVKEKNEVQMDGFSPGSNEEKIADKKEIKFYY